MTNQLRLLVFGAVLTGAAASQASKLAEFQTLDEHHLLLRFQDAWVHHKENAQAPGFGQGHESRSDDQIEVFGNPLDLKVAVEKGTYTLTPIGGGMPLAPVEVYRKTKVSGTAWKWPDPDLTYEHTIYLKLAEKLQPGKRYRLTIAPNSHSDVTDREFVYDVAKNQTEAIHVNLIGWDNRQTANKSADLYLWMGDGGARDYTEAVGRQAYLVDVRTGKKTPVGKVKFWKKAAKEYGNWDLTKSDVWTVDFSSFTGTGKFRLSIDGIGASPEFELKPDLYFEPFKTSVRGFYYMRIGEPLGMSPPPRQPQFIPGKNPPDFKVILTTYSPWHSDWKKGQGDQWDVKDWSKYAEPGNPTNPNAYGGHSDALDWDRHLGHISIIWDLLLPYMLSNGKGGEDNLGIRESGNGVPDVIDEAQNEVDFWLRLRDRKGGYATGLNNPSNDHKTMYQGAAHPYMAWANAANAAMLADAFRLAKKPELMRKYRDAAIEAWTVAKEQGLDDLFSIGNGHTRGRDLKHLAAAALYNVTGEKKFEEVLVAESVSGFLEVENKHNQLYGSALYLMAQKHNWRPVNHPQIAKRMRDTVIDQALKVNLAGSESWPSRRSAETAFGWFQSIQDTQRVCVAHAVTSDPVQKQRLLKALILESDWGLGRNPMNMTQMTGIGSRQPDQIYTSGRNDGVPGVHPGHTPYMNSEPWGSGFMADPKYYANRGYPAWTQWPQGEALWRAPYCYSNNEFTPQQSMRGKHCMYGYLYSLGAARK